MKLLKAKNNDMPPIDTHYDAVKKSILIVDDSGFARKILKDMLEGEGYIIAGEAGDGLEAIEMAKQKRPDYIFMDVAMPKLDGLGALPRIMEINPNMKVIMSTAMGQKSIIVEAMKIGAIDYVLKPYKKENIIDVLNAHLESDSQTSQVINFEEEKKHYIKRDTVTEEVQKTADMEAAQKIEDIEDAQEIDDIQEIEDTQEIEDVQETEDMDLASETVAALEDPNDTADSLGIDSTEDSIELNADEEHLPADTSEDNLELNIEEEGLELNNDEETLGIDTNEESLELNSEEESLETSAEKESLTIVDSEESLKPDEKEEEIIADTDMAPQNTPDTENTLEPVLENSQMTVLSEEASTPLSKVESQDTNAVEEIKEAVIKEGNLEAVSAAVVSENIIKEETLNAVSEIMKNLDPKEEQITNMIPNKTIQEPVVEAENRNTVLELRNNDIDLVSPAYAYLWKNRFDSRMEESFANGIINKDNYVRNFSGLSGNANGLSEDDTSERDIMFDMINAYMSLGYRLGSEDIVGKSLLKPHEGIRLSTYKVFGRTWYEKEEISMSDILRYSNYNNPQNRMYYEKNSLYYMLLHLVQAKSDRILGQDRFKI